MEPLVRVGTERDLPRVVEIYNEYIEHSPATFEVARLEPADRLAWLQQHAGGRYRLFVAESEGTVVGWATTSPFRPRAAYDTTVESSVYCVAPALGQGVGTALYQELFRSIAEEDVERIVAGITLPNPASVRLHRRFGFRPVGTFHRVGRKFGEFWDVEWYERPLKLPPRPLRGRRSPARSPR